MGRRHYILIHQLFCPGNLHGLKILTLRIQTPYKQNSIPFLSQGDDFGASPEKSETTPPQIYTCSQSGGWHPHVLSVMVLSVSQMILVLKYGLNSSAYTGRTPFIKRDSLFNTSFFKGLLIYLLTRTPDVTVWSSCTRPGRGLPVREEQLQSACRAPSSSVQNVFPLYPHNNPERQSSS